MAKLGQDVLEWQTEELVQWLQREGMNDCVATFTLRKINGRSLVNLSESEIKSLQRVSHESKKKLIKAIEKFKRKKKEKMAAMFGGQQPAWTVTRKPPSFSQEDEAGSDDEGWGTDEWDSDGSQEASSESDGGEYLEPEDDLSKTGSLEREAVSSVPSGLVAQLRAGIASSISRTHNAVAPQESYQHTEDIYDEPPEELYDEPSDGSGGAVVVRPPKRPPKQEESGDYLQPREMDNGQELYETPLEEEEESPKTPARPSKGNRVIPTRVAQGNKFVPVNNNNKNNNHNNNNNDGELYDIPDLEEHVDEEDSYEIPGEQTVPPPRPPKGFSAQPNSAVKPTLQTKPFPSTQKPKVLPGKPPFKGPPQPISQPQRTPTRFARPQQSSLSSQGTPFRAQPPLPVQTNSRPPFGKKTDFPSKNTLPPKTVNPGGPERSPPTSPVKSAGESIPPSPGPKPVPRAGLSNRTDPQTRPEAPSLPPAIHRKQATERPPLPEPKNLPAVEPVSSNQRSLPSVPPPQKTEAAPPRPMKAGHFAGNQPPLPRKHSGERPGVPLPAPPPTFSRDLREQSSASSIESTSADEPIISLQHLPKPGKRSLPAPPPMEFKGTIEMMKEAPWFQGPVDRKAVEGSLKKSNQNGAFLVRNSTRSPNDYSMSLICNGNVRHLRIPYKNNKYVLGDSGIQQFDTIIDLVNYYRQNEVDLKTGGKTKLTIPCQVYRS